MDWEKKLKERKKTIEEGLLALKDSSRPVDLNDPQGRLSRMDAIQQQQMALHAKRQLEVSLQQCSAALERLAKDEFGLCLGCEEEISSKRLMAKPESPYCSDCQSTF